MTRILYLLTATLLAGTLGAQQLSITRGSFELAVGPAGSPGPSTNYKFGIGPGQEFNGFNLGNFAPNEVLRLSDMYLFTNQSGGCEVAATSIAYRVYPVSNPTIGTASTLTAPFVRGCNAMWRFSSPACTNGDREYGTGAGTTSGVGLTTFENEGVIALEMTWAITAVSGSTACAPTSVTSTAFFTVGQAPLPVELVRLSAKPSGSGNVVTWAAASETALSHYLLERSTRADLSEFTIVETLPARGATVGAEAVYESVDPAPSGVTYYRLRAVDRDGSAEYSDVVAVRRTDVAGGGGVKVWPNPAAAGGIVSIGLPVGLSEADVFVHDAAGRQVARLRATGTQVDLPLGGVPAGVYAVTARGATASQTVRLVIE